MCHFLFLLKHKAWSTFLSISVVNIFIYFQHFRHSIESTVSSPFHFVRVEAGRFSMRVRETRLNPIGHDNQHCEFIVPFIIALMLFIGQKSFGTANFGGHFNFPISE
jgi:hypothetical protein